MGSYEFFSQIANIDALTGEELCQKADSILSSYMDSLEKEDASEILDEKENREIIESSWGDGLATLRLYRRVCLEIFEGYRRFVSELNIIGKSNTARAIDLINAKAIQVYNEVLCLLENGFADGATAHWRTLFELWVFAELLNDCDDEVSQAFLSSTGNHDSEESRYKWARLSKRFPVDKPIGMMAIIGEARNIIAKQKGENALSKKDFEKVYSFANQILHPSASGILGRVSNLHENESSINVGSSDYGLFAPAITAVEVLFNINFLQLKMCVSNEKVAVVSVASLYILHTIVELARSFLTECEKSFHDKNEN